MFAAPAASTGEARRDAYTAQKKGGASLQRKIALRHLFPRGKHRRAGREGGSAVDEEREGDKDALHGVKRCFLVDCTLRRD